MNFIRSAKSGSEWSQNELIAYNISVSPVPAEKFFSAVAEPSLDHLDPNILTAPAGTEGANLSDAVIAYLGYLDVAVKATQQSSIHDFAARTLDLLGFNERSTLVATRYAIPLTICADSNQIAQTDVCLLHRPIMVLLVLIEDKTLSNRTDTESQVVAEAIAAFQYNNQKRGERGLVSLAAMTIPCIIMSGTRPTFYLVPVTQELSTAVIGGVYPATETQVLKCVTVAAHIRRASEGMEHTEYRKLALKRLLAFRTLAKSHWSLFLDGL